MTDLEIEGKKKRAEQIKRLQLRNKIDVFCGYGNHQPIKETKDAKEYTCKYCRCRYRPE
jgi:hypothetical protein